MTDRVAAVRPSSRTSVVRSTAPSLLFTTRTGDPAELLADRVTVVRQWPKSAAVVRPTAPPRLVTGRLGPMPGPPGTGGQPRFVGDGPPPVTLIGANPLDQYLDRLTGDIYELQ